MPLNPIYATHHLITSAKRTSSRSLTLTLPIIAPWRRRWTLGALTCAFGLSFYLFTNHSSSLLLTPQYLPLTLVDQKIPYLPESVWVYISLFVFVPLSFWLHRCTISINRFLYGYLTLFLVSCMIFYFFPVTYPRHLFPDIPPLNRHPSGFNPFLSILELMTQFLVNTLRTVDTPRNCTPSLHVSTAFLIALGFLEDQKRYFPLFLTWAILLSVSTLTMKQHYLWDVASGFILGVFTYLVFHRVLYYRFPTGEKVTKKIS